MRACVRAYVYTRDPSFNYDKFFSLLFSFFFLCFLSLDRSNLASFLSRDLIARSWFTFERGVGSKDGRE